MSEAESELLEALRYLAAEASGVLGLIEPELRTMIGNTNVNCLKERIVKARNVIAKAEERS